jgi:hypothetical protein
MHQRLAGDRGSTKPIDGEIERGGGLNCVHEKDITSSGIGASMDTSSPMAAWEIGLGYGQSWREGDRAIDFDRVGRTCDRQIKMNGPDNRTGMWPRWERELAAQAIRIE